MDTRWWWLASTVSLQREAYGWDWDAIRARGPVEWNAELGRSINTNTTALVAELGELLQELGPIWKSWVKDGQLSTERRDAAVEELVDVVHFVANIAIALGVTDEEWERLYQAKQQKNRDRQTSGYDGVTGKCSRCHRSYDGAGVECRPAQALYVTSIDTPVLRPVELRPYCAHVGYYV